MEIFRTSTRVTRPGRALRLLLAVTLVGAWASGGGVHAQTNPLVVDSQGPPTEGRSARAVRVDLGRLAEAADAGRAAALDLFGVTVVTRPERVERRGPGRFTWFGSVDGGGRATLTVDGASLVGRIVTARGTVVVEPRGGGHVAYEPRADDPDTGDALRPPIAPPRLGRGTADPLFPDELHVALFYTSQVADSLGAGLPAFLQATVDALSDVLANSAVPARARLVVSAPVDYAESGTMSTDLYAFQDPSDGQMDDVHAVRDAHSADFAALLTETGTNSATSCGIAFLMNPLDVGFADAAFSVTKRSCELGLVFSHEIGHNLGLHHDRYVTQGPTALPFSYGYTNTDSMDVAAGRPGFRTVLAYNRRCTDVGGTCFRIPYYSNPDSRWNGQPMGAAGTEDNAQSARAAVPFASAFRAASLAATVAGSTAGGPSWNRPVCPDPADLSTCAASGAPSTYHATPFRVATAGRHYVRTAAAFAGALAVYAGPFDASAPLAGLAATAEPDASAPAARRLLAAVDLVPGTVYTVVATGLTPGDAGSYTTDVFGPAGGAVVVAEDEAAAALLPVALGAPAPNPSRGTVDLTVRVAASQAVRVDVVDVLGRVVAVLHDGPLAAGAHVVQFGSSAPGMYVVRARSSGGTATQRVTRL